jgi:NADPH:quinone reductase-like Zn-dependent oxidoreductase
MILTKQMPVDESPLTLAEIDTPRAGPGEVRVKVECLRRLPHRSSHY